MYEHAIVSAEVGLLALLFVALSLNVSRLRLKLKVSYGDGGHDELRRAIRAHGNFAEFVPLLIMLGFLCDAPLNFPFTRYIPPVFFGLVLLARLFHAYGILATDRPNVFRFLGAFLTNFLLGLAGLALIFQFLLSRSIHYVVD